VSTGVCQLLAMAAPTALSQFIEKYNAFVSEMNIVALELGNNVANRREMLRAARLWSRLYQDEGWLK